jgi:hypothetical protein
MSAPYGLTSTSFRVNRQIANSFGTEKGCHSVQAFTALAILRSLSEELQARGYDVTSPSLAKNAAIASIRCTLPLMKLDIFLTAAEPHTDWVECKLGPLGWSRTWKSPPYRKIWQEWEQLRAVIDEHLTEVFQIKSLQWGRPTSYKGRDNL